MYVYSNDIQIDNTQVILLINSSDDMTAKNYWLCFIMEVGVRAENTRFVKQLWQKMGVHSTMPVFCGE